MAISPDDIRAENDKGDATLKLEPLWVHKGYDLALLKINDPAFVKATGPAPLDCRTAGIGEEIRAEGNPFSIRFISQWGRVGSTVKPIGPWREAFSIGAPLAPGMSGGPVFDMAGSVVGINVGIGPVGGFYIAVPSSTACTIMGRA